MPLVAAPTQTYGLAPCLQLEPRIASLWLQCHWRGPGCHSQTACHQNPIGTNTTGCATGHCILPPLTSVCSTPRPRAVRWVHLNHASASRSGWCATAVGGVSVVSPLNISRRWLLVCDGPDLATMTEGKQCPTCWRGQPKRACQWRCGPLPSGPTHLHACPQTLLHHDGPMPSRHSPISARGGHGQDGTRLEAGAVTATNQGTVSAGAPHNQQLQDKLHTQKNLHIGIRFTDLSSRPPGPGSASDSGPRARCPPKLLATPP